MSNCIVVCSRRRGWRVNGYALNGVPGSLNGILVSGARHSITIRNGTIRDWDGTGVSALTASGCALRDLILYSNRDGVFMGPGSLVEKCVANANAATGIRLGTLAMARDCVSRSNDGDGSAETQGASSSSARRQATVTTGSA
jgi:hypothetical protein